MYLPNKFILIEGIDGSGKDTFASFLATTLKEKATYHPDHTLSIVGQPAFRFDNSGILKRFIEDGETSTSYEETVRLLKKNRTAHENYLTQYGGTKLCIRGLLTDMGTLERLYGKHTVNLGHNIPIDKVIIIDVDPTIARKRIVKRGIPETWRESLSHLTFFRNFFLNTAASLNPSTDTIIIKNECLSALEESATNLSKMLLSCD